MGGIAEAAFNGAISNIILFCVMLPLGLILLGYLGFIVIETFREVWKWKKKK